MPPPRKHPRLEVNHEVDVDVLSIDSELLDYERSLSWDHIRRFFVVRANMLRKHGESPIDYQMTRMLSCGDYKGIEETYGPGSRSAMSLYVSGYERARPTGAQNPAI